jgi:hypothetical protein
LDVEDAPSCEGWGRSPFPTAHVERDDVGARQTDASESNDPASGQAVGAAVEADAQHGRVAAALRPDDSANALAGEGYG